MIAEQAELENELRVSLWIFLWSFPKAKLEITRFCLHLTQLNNSWKSCKDANYRVEIYIHLLDVYTYIKRNWPDLKLLSISQNSYQYPVFDVTRLDAPGKLNNSKWPLSKFSWAMTTKTSIPCGHQGLWHYA
jgi:hypothetical protein